MKYLLAATGAGALVVPVLLVIGMILGLFVAWRLLRRFFFADQEVSSTPGWDLEEIRRLREAGQISQAEYERLIKVAGSKLVSEYGPRKSSASRRGDVGLHGTDPMIPFAGAVTLNMLPSDGEPSRRGDNAEQGSSDDGFGSGGQENDATGGMDFGGGDAGGSDSVGSV